MLRTNSRTFVIQTTDEKKLYLIYGGNFQNFIFLDVKFTFQNFFLIVDFDGVKIFYVRNYVLNKLCKFRCSNMKKKELFLIYGKIRYFQILTNHHMGPHFQVFV